MRGAILNPPLARRMNASAHYPRTTRHRRRHRYSAQTNTHTCRARAHIKTRPIVCAPCVSLYACWLCVFVHLRCSRPPASPRRRRRRRRSMTVQMARTAFELRSPPICFSDVPICCHICGADTRARTHERHQSLPNVCGCGKCAI